MSNKLNQMESLAVCEAIYWTEGVSAETKLEGIGRVFGFARPRATELANIGMTTPPASASRNRTVRKAAASTNAGTRAPHGSRRDALIELIGQNPGGLTRGEIIERMGLKGSKSGEMSISNALTALKKHNQVRHENQKYLPPIETVRQGVLEQAA